MRVPRRNRSGNVPAADALAVAGGMRWLYVLLLPIQVSFQWKNPDFLLKNPDFLLKNVDFLLKNVDFIINSGRL